MVRLACHHCDRRGQYQRNKLIERYGGNVGLPELRHLIAQCPRRNKPGDACGVFYEILARQLPEESL
jgi:hypothetical protein